MTEARHYQRILDHLATHISRFFYRETRGANCEAGGEARFRGRRVNPRLRCFRCHPSAVRRVHRPSRLGNNQRCSHLRTEGKGKGLLLQHQPQQYLHTTAIAPFSVCCRRRCTERRRVITTNPVQFAKHARQPYPARPSWEFNDAPFRQRKNQWALCQPTDQQGRNNKTSRLSC